MSEVTMVANKTVYAAVPVWSSNGTATTKDDKWHTAATKIEAYKYNDGNIWIMAREVALDKNGKVVMAGEGNNRHVKVAGEANANSLSHTEKCDSKEAKAYLQALGWQGQCTNGVDITYYTVK